MSLARSSSSVSFSLALITRMGLFNRLFGPKQEAPPENINTSFHTMEEFARSIIAHYGAEHFQGDT